MCLRIEAIRFSHDSELKFGGSFGVQTLIPFSSIHLVLSGKGCPLQLMTKEF